ncbi:hypothetical protein [Nocardia cyriacigeorgica]|uniref:TPR repeat region-containing protein n=1 Tax=Nocardia cyriacigeorgica TaxID=135487 RepID=UPI0024572480|nr:hypothetical protein [Nocardia cyriacigeorgica]
MPTRNDINNWKPEKLSEWATELETDTQFYETQLGQILTHFTGTSWSGKAHDAAADRFTEEHDQGRKLSQEIRDVAAALRAADQRLANEKRLLLGKVSDAENDATSPVKLQVADNWVVSASQTGGTLSDQDKQTITDKVNAHQSLINAAYYSLTGAISEVGVAISTATQEIRVRGDQLGDGVDAPTATPGDSAGLGKEDGQALADWASTKEHERDPAVLDRIARQLPPQPLTQEQLRILSEGGEVDSLPPAVQEYYRNLYQTAGKDGMLGLMEHLRTQEEAGNTVAAAQRDSLANGLMVISNEDLGTGRNPDGTLANAGSYQNVPQGLRELIEARRTDPDPVDPNVPGGPVVALQEQWKDTHELASLLGQANPGYEPGTELGTQLYLKSSDMIQDQYHPDGRDEAAASFLDIAGRNDDSSHKIWTGEGMPEGYNAQDTVRSIISYDWSESDNGRGAAMMIDRITEESQLPPNDPRGLRGREALAGLSGMLAPTDNDAVWNKTKEGFANSPELATSVSKAIAANLDAVSTPGQPNGYTETKVYDDGRVVWRAEEANRLLQLGGYSDEGRIGLTTAVEQHRINELSQAMRDQPGEVTNILAGSDAGALTGRVDKAIWDAALHQDQLKGEEALHPGGAVYQAKMVGAAIAGQLADTAIGRVPHGEIVTGATGIEVGDTVESKVQEWLGKPEYDFLERPAESDMKAGATNNAHQAVITALNNAGQLPSEFRDETGPLTIDEIREDSELNRQFNSYLSSRGLNQYITDYGQSYAIDLSDQAKKDDE